MHNKIYVERATDKIFTKDAETYVPAKDIDLKKYRHWQTYAQYDVYILRIKKLGRKTVEDKKELVRLYPRQSTIEKMGGMDALTSYLYEQIEIGLNELK